MGREFSTHTFEDRLALASTLPADWYESQKMLEKEKIEVFGRTWQLVGRSEQVQTAGAYFTAMISDEPILVVRDAESRLRAFSNVCRHRAGPVASGHGQCRVFRCGYHGWTYGLDGRLLGTPEFDEVESFNKEENGLPEFRVETWEGLVFVNLDRDAAPFSEILEDLDARLQRRGLNEYQFAQRKDWTIECNWKVYVDNYLEGYHIPIVHPSLNREIDYARYRTETRRYYSIQHSPIRRRAEAKLRLNPQSEQNEAEFFWIFPNLMLNVYPDNYSTNLIVPLGPSRTLTIFEWFFKDAENPEVREKLRSTVEFSDEIQIQDIGICEAVQRGLRSRTYRRGRYSVKRESGVHHFHGLLCEYLRPN